MLSHVEETCSNSKRRNMTNPPALREGGHSLFQLPLCVPHVAGFRRGPVHIKDLKIENRSSSQCWWSSLLGPVDPSFRALSGCLKFTVRRHKFNKDSLHGGQVLSAVDVIVEVRDARIPTATTHPMVDDWLRNRNAQRVVCMSKVNLLFFFITLQPRVQ